MWGSNNQCRSLRLLLLGLGATVAIGVAGCQSDVGADPPQSILHGRRRAILSAGTANVLCARRPHRRHITRNRSSASNNRPMAEPITAERCCL